MVRMQLEMLKPLVGFLALLQPEVLLVLLQPQQAELLPLVEQVEQVEQVALLMQVD
jgi:hypothetical protein